MALNLTPPPVTEAPDSFAWQQWYIALTSFVTGSGTIAWDTIDKTGSDLADLADKDHNVLDSIQGGTTGEYYHLTAAQHTDLTGLFTFKTIVVSGQSNVVADTLTDTLTFVAGTGITITTDATADSVTITGSNNFGTVAVSGQSNVVADTVNYTLTLVAGTNVTITTDAGADSVTINATGGNIFSTIAVSGQSDVVADSSTDTLTLVAGDNITITTVAGTDSITFAAADGETHLDGYWTPITDGASNIIYTDGEVVVTYVETP